MVRISIEGQENYIDFPFKSTEPYDMDQIESIFVSAIQKFVTDCVPKGSSVAIDVELYSATVPEGVNLFETTQHIEEFLKGVKDVYPD